MKTIQKKFKKLFFKVILSINKSFIGNVNCSTIKALIGVLIGTHIESDICQFAPTV